MAIDYKEAPILAEQVKAGKLPPVAERLPKDPRIVEPVEKVGKYGGTWRSGLVGGSDRNWLFRMAGYEPLVAWDREWSGKVIPNLAESVTNSEDGKVFTVKLRDGLKWSDGKPFTSDDIGFFINDIAGNKDLMPNGLDWLMSGGEAGKFAKIDDTNFTITFKEPYGMFMQRLASNYGVQIVMMAKHYCSQFMPTYNKDGPTVTVTGSAKVNTKFLPLIGINQIPIGAEAVTTWGRSRLRVALVLDNTLSMKQDGKMDALKTATTQPGLRRCTSRSIAVKRLSRPSWLPIHSSSRQTVTSTSTSSSATGKSSGEASCAQRRRAGPVEYRPA